MAFRIRFPVIRIPDEFAPKSRAVEGARERREDGPRCVRCGRPVSAPVSVFLRIGPSCLRWCVEKRWEREEVRDLAREQLEQRDRN